MVIAMTAWTRKQGGLSGKDISFVLTCHIFVMAVAFPLYMTGGGYGSIGHDKYYFFRHATYITLAVLALPLAGAWIGRRRGRASGGGQTMPSRSGGRLFPTEWMMAVFLAVELLSLVLSSHQATAWSGSPGWFIGLETYLLIMVMYLLISRMWKYHEKTWLFFLAGAGMAFLLGICNRFSFYPLEAVWASSLVGADAGQGVARNAASANFISTLGNINWVAGYFAVMWPLGAGLYVFGEKKSLRLPAGMFCIIAICLGLVQGAESVFLSFAAVFYILLLLCMGKWQRHGKAFLELAMAWCFLCQLIRLSRTAWPDRFVYELDGLGEHLTASSFSIYLLLPLAVAYFLTAWHDAAKKPQKAGHSLFIHREKKGEFSEAVGMVGRTGRAFLRLMDNKHMKKLALMMPMTAVLLFVVAVVVNTRIPGSLLIEDSALDGRGIFTFNDDWGNSRGLTWKMGVALFARMETWEKLIGAGADCFADVLYRFPDLAAQSHEQFGGLVLRNAHNEGLTILVNAGIMGTVTYFGIFITLFVRLLKGGGTRPVLYVPAICIFSYLLHNVVSFAQILNLPFIFIIMAMGEAAARQQGTQKADGGGKKTPADKKMPVNKRHAGKQLAVGE